MTNPNPSYQESPARFQTDDEQILERAVLRLSGNILGLVMGILFGLLIFLATNFLVLKGGPVVGPHLSLLRVFFWGYSVTFLGSFIGLVYGLICGYVAGFIIATIYNLVVSFKK